MQAVLLIGHGSLKKASGAAMIRLAAALRHRGLAPIATAGFLNFSRPTFAEAVERCVRKGATELLIQPYFLIPGYYVDTALTRLVTEARAAYPELTFCQAQPFGDHPALAELVLKRLAKRSGPAPNTAVVLMAHGTPKPDANVFIEKVAARVRSMNLYESVRVAYMECNTPTIAEAVDAAASGARHILAAPYFLHLGAHVREDLPDLIAAARVRHPDVDITLTKHLAFDPLLLDVIQDRITTALKLTGNPDNPTTLARVSR